MHVFGGGAGPAYSSYRLHRGKVSELLGSLIHPLWASDALQVEVIAPFLSPSCRGPPLISVSTLQSNMNFKLLFF